MSDSNQIRAEQYIPRDMTLRDYFAMAALPAALADFCDVQHRDDIAYDHAGELAYKIADAMLNARERKE